MLDQYIGECMVSITNVNNIIKEPTLRYQDCNTSKILIFFEYLRIDTRVSLYRYVGSCMVRRP